MLSSRVLLANTHQQTSQASSVILVSLLPHEFFQVCGKQGSGRSELSAELALRAHPQVLNVLCVDLRVVRVHEVHLMDDDVMEEHPSIELRDVLVRCPTVRDDVGAREAPLLDDGQQGLGSSVGHHLQHTSAALSFDGPEHPKSVVESPSVVFPMEKVALVYFYHDRLTVGIESSELHGVSSGVLSADIADEIRPVHERVLRHVKMPGNVVHGGVRCPREEHPHPTLLTCTHVAMCNAQLAGHPCHAVVHGAEDPRSLNGPCGVISHLVAGSFTLLSPWRAVVVSSEPIVSTTET